MVKPGKEAARFPPPISLQLRRESGASRIAREAMSEMCEQLDVSEVCREDLLLLVAEVINNAVLHSDASTDTPILFDASVDAQRFRVEVNDGGRGFVAPQPDQSSSGGWGLRLLDMRAESWGIEASHGTLVWFDLRC